jgi:heat shock protein HtpX
MTSMAVASLVDAEALHRQRLLNRLQSTVLLLGLAALAGTTGFLLAGTDALILAAALAAAFLLFNPAPGDVVFRYGYGAVQLTPATAPQLLSLVGDLGRRAALARAPAVFLIPTPILQAMSAGSREAPSIAVTSGLLQALPSRELAAVLAHEVAHIRHGDMFVMRLALGAGSMTRAMSTAGMFLLLAYFPALWTTGATISPAAIALLIGAPMVSDLLELSLSRRREFLADASAVELTGDPISLARALQRIEDLQGDDWERFTARGGRWLRWFRTHPTTAERIERLAKVVALPRAEPPTWSWHENRHELPHLDSRRHGQRMVRRVFL